MRANDYILLESLLGFQRARLQLYRGLSEPAGL
jgi:hypothetical protein